MTANLPLSAEEAARLLAEIRTGQADPASPPSCPRCHAPDLALEDRSARPYAEWYDVACAACGMRHTLHVPLPGPGHFGG